ncbi:MAG: hypothetical protein KF708_17095 [Pirellulales bacterium]|nr:hypothetical protein [Pirellulales bacterium]
MQFWNWLFGRRHAERIRTLADQLARECVSGVWGRVSRRAPSMSLAEARGYVRARAASVVQAAVRRELGGRDEHVWQPDPSLLTSETTDAVVRLVLKQVLDTKPALVPVRRAA